jgi:3-dehydroquinate synthase
MSMEPQMQPPDNARQTVHVALPGREYDIVIGRGCSQEAGSRLAALSEGAGVAVVSDEHVAALHGEALQENLRASGLRPVLITLPPGEATKSWRHFAETCDAILAARVERGDVVLALGGGVIGDLAGFCAASVRRGMRFVQIPTSLLAQVDSSVGGKTGINSAHGKNLVGAFHQPSLVIADTGLLDTLPPREFRAGYAEVVKYGLIDRPEFFDWCEANWRGIAEGGPERDHAVAESCRAKAAVVIRDEREDGDRALLNLGHTFGHALERACAYDGSRLVHGEGVAIGMAMAFRFSQAMELCPGQDVIRVERHLRAAGLPTRLSEVPGGVGDASSLLDAMGQDKKVRRGELTFILARGIGKSFVAKGVPAQKVRAFLEAELQLHGG